MYNVHAYTCIHVHIHVHVHVQCTCICVRSCTLCCGIEAVHVLCCCYCLFVQEFFVLNIFLHLVWFSVMRVPEFPKPEIKTVMADKIFDPPGRNSRPSHVSVCVCVCVVHMCVRVHVCMINKARHPKQSVIFDEKLDCLIRAHDTLHSRQVLY